jgi:phosphoribosyl-AMP cyclohydrolase
MDEPSTSSFAARDAADDIENGPVFAPAFNSAGLLPAIVSDAGTGEVLMFAWMNRDALTLTLDTGLAHFWSRSRNRMWKKGEESGNILRIVEIRTDCDQDVLWIRVSVEGDGRACHTGRRTCFYRRVEGSGGSVTLSMNPDI